MKNSKLNKKQKIVLWIGGVILIFSTLFPPFYKWGRYRSLSYGCEFHELFNPAGKINFNVLFLEWFIIAVITVGLFIAFETRKK